ncbi:hypothetical protein HK101_006223 [Irineochytrium annulatum]|nr:hypothetical protein HK101_006223 [Irineochytrium annulatum]
MSDNDDDHQGHDHDGAEEAFSDVDAAEDSAPDGPDGSSAGGVSALNVNTSRGPHRGTRHVLSASGAHTHDQYMSLAGLSQTHLKVIEAVAVTFVPSLSDDQCRRIIEQNRDLITTLGGENPPDDADVAGFLRSSAAQDWRAQEDFVRIFATCVPRDKRGALATIFWLLATSWSNIADILRGCSLLTGSRKAPFYDLNQEEREAALLALANSKFELLRGLFKSLKGIVALPVFGKDMVLEGVSEAGATQNPSWGALQYPGNKPDEHPIPPRDHVWEPTFLDMQELAEKAGKGKPIVLEADVVVVGSGPGGGVIAAELSAAGHKVIVLEKAKYRSHADLTHNELESFTNLFEKGAALASENSAMQILAGTAWGGGSYINWCASLRTPYKVREEWEKVYGLPWFTSSGFQNALDTVCERVGVSEDSIEHSMSNQLFIDGCKRLGYDYSVIPQNTANTPHNCGWCTFGCPYAQKQGSHHTWLKDAAENGASFVDGCHVKRIMHARGKATGVIGTVFDGKVQLIVKAPTVVSSCGSINSPALLLRSGLRNPNIGKNLRLHPVTTIHGYYPHKETRPFSGAIMTALSRCVADLEGDGYGALLETCTSHPGILGSILPWRGSENYRELMLQLPRSVNLIVLTRDHDSVASVYIDGEGEARVNFELGKKDAQTLQKGVQAGARILLASGAAQVNSSITGLAPAKVESEADRADPLNAASVKEFMAGVESKGVKMNSAGLSCAHQMGSCRMGATPKLGAVNPDGESWEVKGLYVADASLFPSASGVNPMITTYAITYSVAQFMKRNLEKQKLHAAKL